MLMRQEQLVLLVAELHGFANEFHKATHDPIVRAFGWQFYWLSQKLHEHLHEWSVLDKATLDSLKSGDANHLLDIELISQLSGLLLEDFSHDLTLPELEQVKQIHERCQQIRALLNEAMDRPSDARLSTKLDSAATRYKLGIEFDRKLCTPATQMIEGIERLLASDHLSEVHRRDLERTLYNSQIVHRMLQSVRPLLETQNFRAMALLSHDYHIPFCGITGFFYVLLELENEGLSAVQLDQLRELIAYSGTILSMLNNLQDAVKLIIGEKLPDLDEVTHLSQGVLNLDSLIQSYREKHPQLAIKVEIPKDLPSIQIDANYLRMCLVNLLENAVKYTAQGQVCLDATYQDGFVIFRVQDTGVGIPQDQQARIFEAFTQVGEQTKGLGLGLFLARSYAERVRGSLTVESEVGIGSTFRLRLPVVIAQLTR
jgi:signal transduction histidine kinase